MVAALLKRLPRWRSRFESPPVIPRDAVARYPGLADDFEVLDKVVAPAFREYDLLALSGQNRYRRQQLVMILGSAVVTGLGGLQAVFPRQAWPGVLLALFGVGLAAAGRWVKETSRQQDYLTARVKAERLRALHFRYLSATGRYADADRAHALRRAVVSIRSGKELE
ncbi:MAG TPA: DUF4231 domain-containing protein [Propionibacteriaceae bacterium]|nr:DUF4231 domain-containing protein [Propionibacteriaceae bacterium]